MVIATDPLQGLRLRFGQFNSTFHRQAGNQDGIACQTRHSEIRLLRTVACGIHPRYDLIQAAAYHDDVSDYD